jgi:hypothetical protein
VKRKEIQNFATPTSPDFLMVRARVFYLELFAFVSLVEQYTDGPKGEPHQKAGVCGGERGAKDGFAGRCADQSLYVSHAVRGGLFVSLIVRTQLRRMNAQK